MCITSYEIVIKEKTHFGKLEWQTLVIDEAHRIKNAESQLSVITKGFKAHFKLLLTGTPLQNNLKELWALLYFLMEDLFSDAEYFEQWVLSGEGDEKSKINQLHKILRPFMLRRLKLDVEHSLPPKKRMNLYVKMSPMQKKWYRAILEKNIDAVNGVVGSKKEKKTRLLNIVMQLRKCTNHPYLFQGAEPGPPYSTDQHLVDNSAKMLLLDKLLNKFKANGQKVLVFSQMARMLDILEDYCLWKEWQYCRIDGQTPHETRIEMIDSYNDPLESKFVFLLTTRAGGLGINLTSANVVIMFDSDWNPQVDLQAEDRAHRIGQTKQVYVYRLITENAIDEKILERAQQKLQLDKMVIQQGKLSHTKENGNDYLAMIQHGAFEVFDENSHIVDEDIDDIMKKGEEKTSQLHSKFENVRMEDLLRLESSIDAVQFAAKRGTGQVGLSVEPEKRRKLVAPRPNVPVLHEYQFYPPECTTLQQKYVLFYQKQQGWEGESAEERDLILSAEPLTADEEVEMDRLMAQGFSDWTQREYKQFYKACEKHGRTEIEAIARDMDSKSEEQVRLYHETFFHRWTELPDYPKIAKAIEKGEEKLRRNADIQTQLRQHIDGLKYPVYQLKIPSHARKNYTETEDRLMLISVAKHGYGSENLGEVVLMDLRNDPMLRFDWYIKSRSSMEIQRRITSLVNLMQKEYFDDDYRSRRKSSK